MNLPKNIKIPMAIPPTNQKAMKAEIPMDTHPMNQSQKNLASTTFPITLPILTLKFKHCKRPLETPINTGNP